MRYFLDYLCVALLFVLMWLIANSCQYFVSACQGVSYGAFALVIAVMLTIPTGKYYLQISSIKDFDFVNIFLQSSILKSSVFGLLTLILYLRIYFITLSRFFSSGSWHSWASLRCGRQLCYLPGVRRVHGGAEVRHEEEQRQSYARYLGGLLPGQDCWGTRM